MMMVMMMIMVMIMFFNNNGQLHVNILKQEEVEVIEQEDNKYKKIRFNKMRDRDTYLEELVVGHRLIISLTNM